MSRLTPFLSLYLISHFSFAQNTINSISSLKLLGNYEIPFNKKFKGTTLGGFSGIDYDASRKQFYIISDDRSAKNDARFYSAKIHFNEKGIDSVEFIDVKPLLQPNGKPYPNATKNAQLTPDPESIRYNPLTDEIIWSSEGERTINTKETVLQNPSIQVIGLDGKYMASFTIPQILEMQTKASGPRQNGTLEGLSFTENYSALYACMEEPIYQDGPKAEVEETKSYVRILKFDTKSKISSSQYAYQLEKVAFEATPATAFKVNGVSEIVSLATNQLLVVERSFSTGRLACTIKLFLADVSQAENIASNNSLIENSPKKSATKKLLLNMDSLDIFIDNIEGLTFGPVLPNGHRTLIFVADNNFQFFEKNQFLLFEVIP